MADKIISKVTLSPSYFLSTDHAASPYGRPATAQCAVQRLAAVQKFSETEAANDEQ